MNSENATRKVPVRGEIKESKHAVLLWICREPAEDRNKNNRLRPY